LHHRSEPHTNSHADFNKSERTGASESRSAPRDRVRAGFASKPARRWFGFSCVRELVGMPPEILMVPLAGHTLGHCGVAVRGPTGWLLHAGDAYFIRDEMALDGYSCTPILRAYQRLMAADNATRLLNQMRLRELKRVHGREIRLF
jgi:glyoxylase-like metal-dependent hydrolase (beta-lactamase superfamily II)